MLRLLLHICGAGAADSSMGWQWQMSSAGAGGNRPTVPGQDVPASVAAVLLPPLGAAQQKVLVRAGLWAAVCGPDGVWPCGGVWPSEMRVEGRRRSKMAAVARLYVAV